MDEQDALRRARDELKMLGLIPGWSVGLDNAVRRLGVCRHDRRLITLSREYVRRNPWEQIRQTVLHEAAHAFAGEGVGHGPMWRAQCALLGIPARRCATGVTMPKGVWSMRCPEHGEVGRRHKNKAASEVYLHNGCDQVIRFVRDEGGGS